MATKSRGPYRGSAQTVSSLGTAALADWAQPDVHPWKDGRTTTAARPSDTGHLERVRRRVRATLAFRQFVRSTLTFALAFGVLLAVVVRANAVIQAGYQVDVLKQQVAAAQWEEERLAAAVGRARDPQTVARIAQNDLAMVVPEHMLKIAVHPSPAQQAGLDQATRETHSATVALTPAPREDRETVWAALNQFLYSWFSGGAVEARER